MTKPVLYRNILLKLIVLLLYNNSINIVNAQPNFDSKIKIDDVTIFQDEINPRLYYYHPGELVLSLKKNGAPDFQFLDMRYTGTKCYNDQGYKNFMSILQFVVEMKPLESKVFKSIKKALKHSKAKLVPLPISHITTNLILTDKESKIVKEGSLEAYGKDSYSTSKKFWTKRNFVVRLNKFESQVLNEQLQRNLLGISLDYSYFTNFKRKQNHEEKGPKELIDSVTESLKNEEKIIEKKIVKSDVLSINIDLKKYPNAIKQIDLNEQIPPAYAGLEVRCYDFINELSPDLYMKIVEIEAESVNQKQTIKVSTKFSKKHSDLTTKHISFPYAVYVNTPMRYRNISYKNSGEKLISEWIPKTECSAIIDVTTISKD